MVALIRSIAFAALNLSLIPSICALNFGFPYGSQKVRGVNLGGWLVLEVRRFTSEYPSRPCLIVLLSHGSRPLFLTTLAIYA